MRVGLALVLLMLTGCGVAADPAVAPRDGRYVGVGIFSADEHWQQQRDAPKPVGDRASPIDDEVVIVVTDSRTGEVRQCGNLSGHCIVMNPWLKALAAVPVRLDRSRASQVRGIEKQPGCG